MVRYGSWYDIDHGTAATLVLQLDVMRCGGQRAMSVLNRNRGIATENLGKYSVPSFLGDYGMNMKPASGGHAPR